MKIKDGETYVLFSEIDHIRYWYLDDNAPKDYGDTVLDFTGKGGPISKEYADKRKVGITFLNRNQTEETYVIAFEPVYLMNDDGKTVEKI
jgi:hypothetical protein